MIERIIVMSYGDDKELHQTLSIVGLRAQATRCRLDSAMPRIAGRERNFRRRTGSREGRHSSGYYGGRRPICCKGRAQAKHTLPSRQAICRRHMPWQRPLEIIRDECRSTCLTANLASFDVNVRMGQTGHSSPHVLPRLPLGRVTPVTGIPFWIEGGHSCRQESGKRDFSWRQW